MPMCSNCKHYREGHPGYDPTKIYEAGWCARIVTKREDEYESASFPGVHIFVDDPFEFGHLLVDPMFGCLLHSPSEDVTKC